MNLRDFLRWWLRGLRATAVAVDEALTQRRLHARLDAEFERDTAEFKARMAEIDTRYAEPLAYRYRSIEALMLLPTVTPDRSGYQRPAQSSVDDVLTWMVYERPAGWWGAPIAQVRDAAVYWLALRESVTGVRL